MTIFGVAKRRWTCEKYLNKMQQTPQQRVEGFYSEMVNQWDQTMGSILETQSTLRWETPKADPCLLLGSQTVNQTYRCQAGLESPLSENLL